MTIFRYKPLNWQKARLVELGDHILGFLDFFGVKGTVFHLLGHIPEQYEDIFTILIDGKQIMQFEVPHDDPKPTEIKHISVETYSQSSRGLAGKKLKAALEEARKLLRESK